MEEETHFLDFDQQFRSLVIHCEVAGESMLAPVLP